LANAFFRKYFPASAQHAALRKLYDYKQEEGENIPQTWTRFLSLIRAQLNNPLSPHEILDLFYNGLTEESRTYLDSIAGCVFRQRTPEEAGEMLAKISQNYDDWVMTEQESTPEPEPTSTLEPEPLPKPKKRGILELSNEVMKEAKKSLKEKGIRAEDVKYLPPMEEICKIPPPPAIEVNSLLSFDSRDIPYSKPPNQCLDELDNFIVKQNNFNLKVENHLLENSRAIEKLQDIAERTSNDIKMIMKHFQMVQTQMDQLMKVQKDMLNNAAKEKQACEIRTRSGIATQDPLYPEGHPKRIEQDSQQDKNASVPPKKKKKKKHKTVEGSS